MGWGAGVADEGCLLKRTSRAGSIPRGVQWKVADDGGILKCSYVLVVSTSDFKAEGRGFNSQRGTLRLNRGLWGLWGLWEFWEFWEF